MALADWRRHRRQSVLHHALAAAAPRREVHGLRPRRQRHGRRRSDSAAGCDSSGCGSGMGRRCSEAGSSAASFKQHWELAAGVCKLSVSVQQKRGRRSPPFLAGAAAYRFLPPFFFPPLAVFFAIALYPPLRVGFVREEPSPYRSAAAIWHAGGASIRRSSPRVGPLCARSARRDMSAAADPKKSGVLKSP